MSQRDEHRSRGHYCVDYCQPPEHSDLCYSNVEYDNGVGNHLQFEGDYWHLYRVVVTRVRRLPDLDGGNGNFGTDRKGRQIKPVYIRLGDELPQKAFEVRWRGDLPREPNRLKRLHAMQHIYGACKFTNCDLR